MAFHVAIVQPESELVNVTAKVLRIDMVINAMQTALQHRPDAFDIVGRNAIADILASRMADRLVLVEQAADSLIAAVLIRVTGGPRLCWRVTKRKTWMAGSSPAKGNWEVLRSEWEPF